MCAESSSVISGFGNYSRNILSRLHHSGKYEVAELSCYRSAQTPKTEPWTVFPNIPTDPEALKNYNTSNPSNAFGMWAFDAACCIFKPDIVLDIRDYWMLSFVEVSPLRPYFHWLIAPTIDSAPQKPDWLQTFTNADSVSAHTQWGIDYLKSTGLKINLVEPLNDSVDTNSFCVSASAYNSVREENSIPQDDFIVGTVMRNQKRKLIPNLIKIIKKLSLKYKNVKLYLHTSYPDNNGWDIPGLLLEHDAADLVYLTYKCQNSNCQKFFISKYHENPAICKFCHNPSATICNVTNGLTDQQLSNLYNIFDVYVQYAICEGFGIPVVEAASCGTKVITVDHGAMREIGLNIGSEIVKLDATFRELETGADRVTPDDNDCLSILEKLYIENQNKNWLDKLKEREVNREKLLSIYSWDKTANTLMNIIDNIQLVNDQGKWDAPLKQTYPEINAPKLPSNREFINFIIDNILDYPYLKQTGIIQNIIRSLDNGFVAGNNRINKFTIEEAVKSLEAFLNNKNIWEKVRVGEIELPPIYQYLLNYK